jgi:hypothetical protein
VARAQDVRVFLVGFRYLNLREDWQNNVSSSGIGFDATDIGSDRFVTHNDFMAAPA